MATFHQFQHASGLPDICHSKVFILPYNIRYVINDIGIFDCLRIRTDLTKAVGFFFLTGPSV